MFKNSYPSHSTHRLIPLAALLLASFLFSGCNQVLPAGIETATPTVSPATRTPRATSTPRATPTPTNTPEPRSQITLGADALNGVAVRFWHPWSGSLQDAVHVLVDDFNASNEWGIRVEAVPHTTLDELSANLKIAMEGGELPDLAVGYVYQAQEWDDLHELRDINQYLDDPIWGLSAEEQADFYPIFWEHDVAGDKRLGIPAYRSAQMLYYNESWAKALGFNSPPLTHRQFKQQACAAATANREDDDPSNNNTGGFILSTSYSSILSWMYAFGGEVTDSRGYHFDTPEVENLFSFLRGLYDDGCAWLPENPASLSEFAGRRGLFAVGSVPGIPEQKKAFELAGARDQWTLIPFPSPTSKPAMNAYGPAYVMLPSGEREELAAWLFIKWMVSPESQALFVRASSSFPLRESALEYLEDYGRSNLQWSAAVEALPSALPEPPLRSWGTVRWTLFDASTQLFRYYFSVEQVPTLVEFLQETAADLHRSP